MSEKKDKYTCFGARIVFKGTDEEGDIFVLEDGNGQLVLSFDTIYEQSRMDVDHPVIPVHDYIRVMLMALAFCQPRTVLVLGLGGGALVRALHHFDDSLSITAVELREMVATIANRYFSLPVSRNINLFITEAGEYMHKRANSEVDIVFVDLYEANEMHPVQKQILFVADCIGVLSEEGWLVFNFHKMPKDNSAFMVYMKQHFPTILVCTVEEGNYILLARRKALEMKLPEYKQNIANLESRLNAPLMTFFYRLSYWKEKPIFMRKSARKSLSNTPIQG